MSQSIVFITQRKRTKKKKYHNFTYRLTYGTDQKEDVAFLERINRGDESNKN